MSLNKDREGFCLLEVSWLEGLFIDFMSFEINEIYHSLFCVYVSLGAAYLELFGYIIVDTMEGDDEFNL